MNTEERQCMFAEIAFLVESAMVDIDRAETVDEGRTHYFSQARRALAEASMILEAQFEDDDLVVSKDMS